MELMTDHFAREVSEFVFSMAVSRDVSAAGRPRPYGQRLTASELRKCSASDRYFPNGRNAIDDWIA